jgi:hypothetical protein
MPDPIPLRLRADQAERIIQSVAQDSANVDVTLHARERMVERDISRTDLDRILRTGHVIEEPFRNEHKEWQCNIIKRLAGRRDAGAVTVITSRQRLVIRTVEWEDPR